MIENVFFKTMNSLGPFENKPHLAIGVSGGSDSLCLTLLCEKWVKRNGGKISALVIDYGLRKNSKKECEQLRKILSKKKISNYSFKWDCGERINSLQERARDFRYKTFEEWCFKNNIFHLLIGHHFDDQKETFLIRLNSNSDVYGLSSMSKILFKKKVRILRPLLSLNKEEIKNYLIKHKIQWIEDESNKSSKYARNRYRKALPILEKEGLTNKKFQKVLQNAQKKRKLLENKILNWLIKNIEINPLGYATVIKKSLLFLNKKEFVIILNRILMTISGKAHNIKNKNLINFFNKIVSNKIFPDSNLGGCHIFLDKKKGSDKIYICREIIRNTRKQTLKIINDKFYWDARFEIDMKKKKFLDFRKKVNKSLYIDQLKLDGWKDIKAKKKIIKKNNRILIKLISSLPAFKDKNKNVLSVPHLNYYSNLRNKKLFSNINMSFKPSLGLTRFN